MRIEIRKADNGYIVYSQEPTKETTVFRYLYEVLEKVARMMEPEEEFTIKKVTRDFL